jgi:hypothetical protein
MGSSNNNSRSTRSKAIQIEDQGSGEDGGGPRKSRNGGNNGDDWVKWFNMLEQELAGTGSIIQDKSKYNRTLIRTQILTRVETRIKLQLKDTCMQPYRVVRRENITARLRETRWHVIPGIIILSLRTTTDTISIVPREELLSADIPVITSTTIITMTILMLTVVAAI